MTWRERVQAVLARSEAAKTDKSSPFVSYVSASTHVRTPIYSRKAANQGDADLSGHSAQDRAAKRAELLRLVQALAEAEPEHWSDADIAEALAEGERDLDAAILTWREVLARLQDARRGAFDERAAILEYDGGLSRDDAERMARMSVYGSRAVH